MALTQWETSGRAQVAPASGAGAGPWSHRQHSTVPRWCFREPASWSSPKTCQCLEIVLLPRNNNEEEQLMFTTKTWKEKKVLLLFGHVFFLCTRVYLSLSNRGQSQNTDKTRRNWINAKTFFFFLAQTNLFLSLSLSLRPFVCATRRNTYLSRRSSPIIIMILSMHTFGSCLAISPPTKTASR